MNTREPEPEPADLGALGVVLDDVGDVEKILPEPLPYLGGDVPLDPVLSEALGLHFLRRLARRVRPV